LELRRPLQPPLSRFPVLSLLLEAIGSLAGVPSARESPILGRLCRRSSQYSVEVPCIFPEYQGIQVETSSLMTVPTTTRRAKVSFREKV
jgi:hypothetical protein